MSEKRMLILDAELVKKIDENRGDMNRSEFPVEAKASHDPPAEQTSS